MVYIDVCDGGYLVYQDRGSYFSRDYDLTKVDTVITQSSEVIERCKNLGVPHMLLSSYLNISDDLSLYGIFSYYFDGKVSGDLMMLQAVMSGLVLDSGYCYCLKIGVTFCWFVVESKGLRKIGVLQFSEVISKYTVGKFMKRLQFGIAMSGYNLRKVVYLSWSHDDIDTEFGSYIKDCHYLVDLFDKVDGLRGVGLDGVMRLLSGVALYKSRLGAEVFIDCLNESFDKLGLHEVNGELYINSYYYKDYSSCYSSVSHLRDCEYGVIIDCEGKGGVNGVLSAGCRELGGIIYCRYKDVLINIDMFSCDELLLSPTLEQVVRNFRSFSSSLGKSIKVLCFGSSDIIMLKSSIEYQCDKKSRKLYSQIFRYYDCRDFILNNLSTMHISIEGKRNLSNIARALGVLCVLPRHKAINDTRTLFNVLARILQETGEFI